MNSTTQSGLDISTTRPRTPVSTGMDVEVWARGDHLQTVEICVSSFMQIVEASKTTDALIRDLKMEDMAGSAPAVKIDDLDALLKNLTSPTTAKGSFSFQTRMGTQAEVRESWLCSDMLKDTWQRMSHVFCDSVPPAAWKTFCPIRHHCGDAGFLVVYLLVSCLALCQRIARPCPTSASLAARFIRHGNGRKKVGVPGGSHHVPVVAIVLPLRPRFISASFDPLISSLPSERPWLGMPPLLRLPPPPLRQQSSRTR